MNPFSNPTNVQDLSFQLDPVESEKSAAAKIFEPEKLAKENTQGQIVRFGEYSPDLIPKMLEFFTSREKTKEVVETMVWKNGEVHENVRFKAMAPPMFSEFARSVGVSERTLKKWAQKNKEFGEAMEICTDLIREFIITHGLQGEYSSQFAIFAGKNIAKMQDKHVNENHNYDIKGLLDNLEGDKPVGEEE